MALESTAKWKWNYIKLERAHERAYANTHIGRKESTITIKHTHIFIYIYTYIRWHINAVMWKMWLCMPWHTLTLISFRANEDLANWKDKTHTHQFNWHTHTHTNVISLLANIKNPKIQNEIDDDWIKATHQDNRSDRQWQIEIVIQNEQAKRYCQIL